MNKINLQINFHLINKIKAINFICRIIKTKKKIKILWIKYFVNQKIFLKQCHKKFKKLKLFKKQ